MFCSGHLIGFINFLFVWWFCKWIYLKSFLLKSRTRLFSGYRIIKKAHLLLPSFLFVFLDHFFNRKSVKNPLFKIEYKYYHKLMRNLLFWLGFPAKKTLAKMWTFFCISFACKKCKHFNLFREIRNAKISRKNILQKYRYKIQNLILKNAHFLRKFIKRQHFDAYSGEKILGIYSARNIKWPIV